MKVLLTGATGFIGRALCKKILTIGELDLAVSMRSMRKDFEAAAEYFVGTLSGDTDWSSAVDGRQVVIHTAARVHVMREADSDPLSAFRAVNVDATLNLARQSAIAGVKRFIFISSIGVNGCVTSLTPFSYDDEVAPHSAYALSKYEAEVGLRDMARETGMEVVIIRPPLVYGPNAPGNFGALMRWVWRGLPLPLGGVVDNRRSLVALDNLIDLIMVCIHHPKAANQVFLVADGEDLSTAELLQRMGSALKVPARLLNVPVTLLSFVMSSLRMKAVAQSLIGSLQVDISHTCQTLGWKPPISVDEGLVVATKGLIQ